LEEVLGEAYGAGVADADPTYPKNGTFIYWTFGIAMEREI